jgi:hypothetical protein
MKKITIKLTYSQLQELRNSLVMLFSEVEGSPMHVQSTEEVDTYRFFILEGLMQRFRSRYANARKGKNTSMSLSISELTAIRRIVVLSSARENFSGQLIIDIDQAWQNIKPFTYEMP